MTTSAPRPLAFLLPASLAAIVSAGTVAAQPLRGPGEAGELESFADGVMARSLEEHHVPGAVLVVVKGGRFLLAKGYGQANLEQKRPVDPERTVFRAASVSKVVTATAV